MNGLMITSFCINTNVQLNFDVDHFFVVGVIVTVDSEYC